MLKAQEIIDMYISFFKKREHKKIEGAPLVPQNDPTTLFTSSGMQPLIPYFFGEPHALGKRLVDVQNCFRTQDIDEVGDNRHTTFFRMLGNWSFGGYFKKEQLSWFLEFLTSELKLDPKKLYVSVFEGEKELNIPKDEESEEIWKELFKEKNIDPEGRIFHYGVNKNWWSRSGLPKDMPTGEPGGPDSEVFYDFGSDERSEGDRLLDRRGSQIHEKSEHRTQKCHINCECGRYLEIGNSVFMEYVKREDGTFGELPQKNVDFGGGLERLLAAVENNPDIFQTSLFYPIIKTIEKTTNRTYADFSKQMRLITDHFVAGAMITANGIKPSNKEQGYILRRLLRRGLDNFYQIKGKGIEPVLESIVEQYKTTDPYIVENFENIKFTILEEEKNYRETLKNAKNYIAKKYKVELPPGQEIGDELKGVKKISAQDAFILYSTHGLSPTQIKSLGFEFNEQEFAEKMEEHQKLSRQGAEKKFKGGLADQSEQTVMGHTATHLLHKALRDLFGEKVRQTGSNITSERVRFDFNFERQLTDEEISHIEHAVNQKIKENLPVSLEIMPIEKAKEIGAIGLFGEKYEEKVKVYFVGPKENPYSVEICGGPHVDFTGRLKRFKIIKKENIGKGKKRIYATVE